MEKKVSRTSFSGADVKALAYCMVIGLPFSLFAVSLSYYNTAAGG